MQRNDRVSQILAKKEQLGSAMDRITELEQPPELLPHEVEAQRKRELLSKVRELRARLLINKGEVKNGKPNKIYVWVNQREERQTTFQGLGYTLCKDPDVQTQWKTDDGSHRRGDLVLYEVDREVYEVIKLDSQIRAVEQMDSSRDSFREFAAGAGVRTYEVGG